MAVADFCTSMPVHFSFPMASEQLMIAGVPLSWFQNSYSYVLYYHSSNTELTSFIVDLEILRDPLLHTSSILYCLPVSSSEQFVITRKTGLPHVMPFKPLPVSTPGSKLSFLFGGIKSVVFFSFPGPRVHQ